MINRIIDSREAFKFPGHVIQLEFDSEIYFWLHNRYLGYFDAALRQLADAEIKSPRLQALESAVQIDLFLGYEFKINFQSAVLKEEYGVERKVDASTLLLKDKDVEGILKRTDCDLSEKSVSEAYKILLTSIKEESILHPVKTLSFFDRLKKKSEANFNYSIITQSSLKTIEELPPFVIGVGSYMYKNNVFYIGKWDDVYKKGSDFVLPDVRVDLGDRLLGSKIIYG